MCYSLGHGPLLSKYGNTTKIGWSLMSQKCTDIGTLF